MVQGRGCHGLSTWPAGHHGSAQVISFNSAISACETSGYWRAALQLVRLMMFIELTPTAVTCSSAISACDKGERWRLSAIQLNGMWVLKVNGQAARADATHFF